MKNKREELLNEKLSKLFFKLSIPSIYDALRTYAKTYTTKARTIQVMAVRDEKGAVE